MAMVLSMMTLKQGKEVKMTLCSSAGDLAVKGKKSTVLKPHPLFVSFIKAALKYSKK